MGEAQGDAVTRTSIQPGFEPRMRAVAPHQTGDRIECHTSLRISGLRERDRRTMDISETARASRVSVSYLSLQQRTLILGNEVHALIVMNLDISQRISTTVHNRACSLKVNAIKTAVKNLDGVEYIAADAAAYLLDVDGIEFGWRIENDKRTIAHAVVLKILFKNKV